jgi:hypothetical protein
MLSLLSAAYAPASIMSFEISVMFFVLGVIVGLQQRCA